VGQERHGKGKRDKNGKPSDDRRRRQGDKHLVGPRGWVIDTGTAIGERGKEQMGKMGVWGDMGKKKEGKEGRASRGEHRREMEIRRRREGTGGRR